MITFLQTVIDNVSYNYILTLKQTWNMNVLFCNWTPWALANHKKTKTVTSIWWRAEERNAFTSSGLHSSWSAPLCTYECHKSTSRGPHFHPAPVVQLSGYLNPVPGCHVGGHCKINHVQDCVLKSYNLSHEVKILSHLSSDSLWTAFISKPKKNR